MNRKVNRNKKQFKKWSQMYTGIKSMIKVACQISKEQKDYSINGPK